MVTYQTKDQDWNIKDQDFVTSIHYLIDNYVSYGDKVRKQWHKTLMSDFRVHERGSRASIINFCNLLFPNDIGW